MEKARHLHLVSTKEQESVSFIRKAAVGMLRLDAVA
jgi:hypothetical protein